MINDYVSKDRIDPAAFHKALYPALLVGASYNSQRGR